MNEPLLSVIVCTFNQSRLLSGCLHSLAGQSLEATQYEILVVNNNSTDNTQEIAESFAAANKNCRILFEAKQGLSHARNCGWRAARGPIVAFIDDDAKASPDWCEKIVQAFATISPGPVAAGGEIQPFYEARPPKWFVDEFEIRSWGKYARFIRPPRFSGIVSLSGSNMAFKKEILEEFGGFSPSYGMVGKNTGLGEETEFFSRVYRKYPLVWYDPGIKVFHWTPVRNMKIGYRFKRAFKAGQTVARMRNSNFYYLSYLAYCAYLLIAPLTIPFWVPAANRRFLTVFVQKCENIGYVLGYLSR